MNKSITGITVNVVGCEACGGDHSIRMHPEFGRESWYIGICARTRQTVRMEIKVYEVVNK